MLDIHAHILPGLDDGPATMADALKMARIAVEDGIRVMIATPHCLNGLYHNFRKDIMAACSEFNAALKNNQIPPGGIAGRRGPSGYGNSQFA